MKKQLLMCVLTIFLGIFISIVTLGLIQFLLLIILGLTINKDVLEFISLVFIAVGIFISFFIIIHNNYFQQKNNN